MDRATDPRTAAPISRGLRWALGLDALQRARAVESDVVTLLLRLDQERPRTGPEIRRYGEEIRQLAVRVQVAATAATAAQQRPWWARWWA
jgi:hypothetical protein